MNKLPESLTTVTTFSKFLAGALFIIFPLVAFVAGFEFGRKFDEISATSDEALVAETQEENKPAERPTANEKPVAQPAEGVQIPEPMVQTGIIEGSLSYPSHGIPPLTICAEETTTKKESCTTKNIEDQKYTYGKGYQLEVEAGTYLVYVKVDYPEPTPDQKIYYSEFVTCGLNAECPSHNPIPVKVEAGKTISKIDPQDWYAN